MKRIFVLLLSCVFVLGSAGFVMSCSTEDVPQKETDQTPGEEGENQEPGQQDGPEEPGPDTPPTPPVEPVKYKILAIGNSYTEDSVEQNLYELFQAAGIKVIIGNLYYPSCNFKDHVEYSQSEFTPYHYRKVKDGVKKNTDYYSVEMALKDEEWTHIAIHPGVTEAGIYSDIKDYVPQLISFVQQKAKKKDYVLMYHMTWAVAADYDNWAFKTYFNSDQLFYYNSIISTTQAVLNDNGSISLLIPTGTAIQNGRTSAIGDKFNRDGFHLDLTHGRYTAACTWFEAISGTDVVGNTYCPSTVSDQYKSICQQAAHNAVLKPYEITSFRQ